MHLYPTSCGVWAFSNFKGMYQDTLPVSLHMVPCKVNRDRLMPI